jgi:hypothetical protein
MKTGGCFCGAVRYECRGQLRDVIYCHCSKCRKWHGHFGAYSAIPHDKFAITESRGLKWHQVNPKCRRGFCDVCGSSILFDEEGDPNGMGICMGTLDDPTGLKSQAHIFVGSKGDYYEIGEGLPMFETSSSGPGAKPVAPARR